MTKRFVAAALTAACLALPAAAPAADCAPAGGEKIVTTELQAFFDALAADDANAWSRIIAPDFYAFDADQRLDGNALFDLVHTAHNAGVQIAWHLDQIDVHVDCASAWFSLMNHGSVGGAGTSQPVTWQESGLFVYRQGQWRLRFFHSNRVQPKA